MPDLLTPLDAFLQEHRRCGELDGGLDRGHVWMACTAARTSCPLSSLRNLRPLAWRTPVSRLTTRR